MDGFVGRSVELGSLERMLARVERGGRTGRPGRAMLIRGRRRVGKSRLAEEFIQRQQLPHVFFTASAQATAGADIDLFAQAVAQSDLPGAHIFRGQEPKTWDAALSLLASILPKDRPSVVVLDEMPYIVAADPGFEGTLQKIFDRELSRLPVLLLCIGSDLAMMEALNEYGRPFHQRATELVVPPLSPADVATLLDLPAAEALDAYLVSGGLPLILDEWPHGATLFDYLADAVTDPVSALLVTGERSLAAEFPTEAQARLVLGAIGSGVRSFGLIGRAAGDLQPGSLSRALRLLADKRMIDVTVPLSSKPSRETRYNVTDPHLRFWLSFLGPHLAEIERGRGDQTLERILKSWASWRGQAIEPVVRESLRRMPQGALPDDTNAIGGYWTRTNDPEIDLVGADRDPIAKRITMVGSIKWRDNSTFDARDVSRLAMHRSQLPGAGEDAELIAVSRSGGKLDGVRVLMPEDLLEAWR